VWLLGMAHQYPDRYRNVARDRLAGVLSGATIAGRVTRGL
jgi:hypothetical protein